MNRRFYATTLPWTATLTVLLSTSACHFSDNLVLTAATTTETTASPDTTTTDQTSTSGVETETDVTTDMTTDMTTETSDPTTMSDSDTTSDTSDPSCGNLVVEEGEECDPPSTGWCNNDCTLMPGCGNGKVEEGEDCDYGSADPESAPDEREDCDPDCSNVECGDGYVNMLAGEVCDPDEESGLEEKLGCIVTDTPGNFPGSGYDCQEVDSRLVFVTERAYEIEYDDDNAVNGFYTRNGPNDPETNPPSARSRCFREAKAVGLADEGETEAYRAWLSLDDESPEANAIEHTKLADHPVLIGVQSDGLNDLENFVFAVWNDENGYEAQLPFERTVGGPIESTHAWTASSAAGEFDTIMNSNDCSGWTEILGQFSLGGQPFAMMNSTQWTDDAKRECGGSNHFYCVEQPIPDP